MSHKYVTNKATFKNEGFLSQLSSTLMTRRAPPPEQMETRTTLKWHKTSEVKERIKTATGTIAVYSDMSQEEVEALRESVATIPTLEEAQQQETQEMQAQEEKTEKDVVVSVIAEAATMAVQSIAESTTTTDAKSAAIYIALDDYLPETNDGLALVSGQKVEVVDFGSQSKWLVKDSDTGLRGYVPSSLLGAAPAGALFATSIKRSLQEMSSEESQEVKRKLTKEMKEIKSSKLRKSSSRLLGPTPEEEARAKRTATIKELIETEEEFVKDLEFVVENYYNHLDDISTPKRISDHKDIIFGNFKIIADFHQNVLIEGVKFHSEVPSLIGKTFLRLERDFDNHSEYCISEPLADEFLETNPDVKSYFEELSEKISDEKSIEEHLKLPIQRLNDYQLLLKEIIKFSNRLGDETTDLERAHDLMQTIPQRATDAKFLASIEGFRGNLFKLGRLIRHDWFSVSEVGHKTHDRYLFLFKARILITKVKRINEDRSIFVLRDIIRLPETSLCGLERPKVLEFHHIEPQNHPNFPITLEARSPEIRNAWLEIVKEHVIDTASVDDLLFDDEIRVVSEEGEEEEHGHISPVVEGEDLIEDLPEDIEETDQVVPQPKITDYLPEEEQSVKPVESQLLIEEVFERIIPIEVEEDVIETPPVDTAKRTFEKEEEFDFFGDKESSPPLKKRVVSIPEEETVESVGINIVQEETTFEFEESNQRNQTNEFRFFEESNRFETVEEETKFDFGEVKSEVKQITEESKQTEESYSGVEVVQEETKFEFKETQAEEKQSVEVTNLTKDSENFESFQKEEFKTEFEKSKTEDKQSVEQSKLTEDSEVVEETTKLLAEVKTKRPIEEDKDEEVDFWATKESSPPLKKLATPQAKERTPPAVLEVSETKEEQILEQVEISAKAEEKVAEQKQDLTLEAKEDFEVEGSPKTQSETKTDEFHQEKEVVCKKEEQTDKSKSKVGVSELKKKESFSKKEIKEEISKEEVKSKEEQTKQVEEDSLRKRSITADTKERKKSKEEPTKRKTSQEKKETLPENEEVVEKKSFRKKSLKKDTEKEKSKPEVETSKPEVLEEPQELKETPKKEEVEEKTSKKVSREESFQEKTSKKVDREESFQEKPSKKVNREESFQEKTLEVDTSSNLKEESVQETILTELLKEQTEEKTNITPTEPVKKDLSTKPDSSKTDSDKKEESQGKDLKRKEPEKKGPVKKKSKTESQTSQELEPKASDSQPAQKFAEPTSPPPSATSTSNLPKDNEKEEGPSKDSKTTVMEPSPAPGAFGSKPVFTKSLAGDVVEPGDGATFVCEVEHPDPYYVTWLKDNKVLDDKLADRVQQSDDGQKHVLRLLNCKTEDSGIYTAKATDNNTNSATCSAQLLVQELTAEEREARIAEKKPFFLVKMIPTEVIENTKLSYAVHVKGDPMPAVTFYKDGAVLKEDERVTLRRDADQGKYELVIGHVQMADAGVYKCVAMNKYEKAECEATMAVAEETKALANLSGKGSLLKPGESADFKWFRDGVEFDPVERFNVMFKDEEDTLALVFQNVTPDDAGIYTCVASTSCGKISCSAELTVEGSINRLMKDPEPPAIQEELSDTYVSLGGTAMLECRVSGYPKPDLSWTRNGLDVKIGGRVKQLWEDEEGVTLIIKNVNESDKGLYNVIAKNDLGVADSSCKLLITSVPKFRKFEKLIGCDVGQPLVFSVEVDGEPMPELKWMKDGKELEPSDHVKFEATPDGKFTMKIDAMKPEDCGAYTIVATNDMGQRTEQFEIQAETAPEITRGFDPETEKKAGNDHTFEIRAKGSPKPDAVWFKNGKEISSDDKFRITTDGNFYMLKIRSISRADRGLYKIVLTNKKGQDESEGQFVVRGPPEFTNPLKDACAKEGAKDIKLFVEWDANPRPSVKWFFKDKVIHEETEGFTFKSTDTTSLLTIHNATADFVAQYTITASNEYGDRSSSAKFRLHEAPQIIEPLTDVEFLEDTKCKFQCKVSGVPIPDIKWTKDGNKWNADEKRVITKKEGEEVYMLVFEAAKTEDSAKYVALLSNVEGKVSTEGSITVNTPPHIAGSNFREGKTLIAMHKFVLEVEATAVPQADATWFFNGKELKEEEDSVKFSFDGKVYRMERVGSDPEHSGEYKCKLKNKIKEEEEVGSITVIEKEARVRQALKNVHVKEKTDGTIQCQIVGDPLPTVEWFRNGKPVMPSERIEIREDREKRMHFLTFKGIEENDKSTFTLKAKNEHGECETSCVMAVYVIPRAGELQDTTVDFGRDLLLNVSIHAIPPPDMTWFKNGKKLDESDRVIYLRDEENEVYSLQIKSVVLEDDATYTYTAKNVVGEATGKSVVKIHTEKPTIVTDLRNMEVCLEDEVSFSIKYAGLPSPVVEWKNKGVTVNSAERYSTEQRENDVSQITLKNLQIEDYGEIKAIAKNLVGEAVSSAKLLQKKLPCEVIQGLDNVTKGGEGNEVTLVATIKGSPRPEFVWTKDGDVVESSANIKLAFKKTSYCEATISLTIIEASSGDSGQYRLRFYNELNEAQTETALIVRPVKRKPKLSSKPGNLEVAEMEPGVFKCKISGYPKPDVKWLKDGRVVRPTDILNSGMTADGEYYLEFKNITMEDAGKYTVVAENDEGKVEADVQLTVNPSPTKPKFIAALKPTKVIAGYPCRMEVQLDGFPRPKVAWLKNGKPVEVDGNHIKEIVTDDGRVILQIANASDGDAGEYSAVAKNNLGESASTASLSVLDHERKDGQDGLPKFSEGLRDGCFDEGKTIRLPVSVRGGPVPDMAWFKDGKEIKLGDRVFFTYDGDKTFLEIHPCVGSDTGKYKCVIDNDHGTSETECEVTVRKCFEPPGFTYLYPNQQKLPGGDAKFTIKVDGVPKPELSWYFNGNPVVPDGEKYRIRKDPDGCTLFVKDTTYSDSGKYKVVATNKEGKAEHEASLLVADEIDPNTKSEAPNILKTIGDQELYEGYTAKFKAVVSGRPQPEFEWYRNGVKIFPNNRITSEIDGDGLIRLNIKYVCSEDAGVYELKVWNEHGKASCKGKLICECISKHKKRPVGDEYKGFNKVRQSGVPIPLSEKPIISALSDRRCTLSWLPHISTSASIPVTYQVEMCECPEGDWITTSTGIRGCCVDILNLAPKSDYKFRVRVENKFGVSEPSPYISTFRNRLERDPISYEPYLDPRDDSPADGPFVPSGFRIDRDPYGNFSAPPRFLRLDHDTQYGMKNFSGRVKWVAYGYPTPKLRFYFKEEEIHFTKGGKYTYTQEPNGEIYLFIDRINENDVGWYKCEAFNEYGESNQRVRLGLSEYPRVLQHLQETYIRGQGSGRIYCRISAYPPCDVKWFKDWHEIKPSMKMKPQFIEPDMYCLNFNGLSPMDTGLYSIAAVNVAGAVSSSCMVHVEDDEATFNWYGYGRGKNIGINTRRGTLEDHYDIGDELGRGTQGVTYHCSERHSGRNFAAKSMWGKDQFKTWMHMEYDMMNLVNSSKRVVRLFDAYEGYKNMVLVMELCSGGELLYTLTKKQYITEYEIAFYIRQVLEGLDYMHDRWIAHLGLNIGDILVSHPNGTDIKISDLSLARNIRLNKLQPLEYGMPEFVAPEVIKLENVSYSADMWAVGVITYLLLSGTSPFRGEHDRETLTRIREGELRFDVEAFSNLSNESKDFIAKLLQYNPEHRMDVKGALNHPWMRFSDMTPLDPYKISTDRLRTYYYSKYRDWYANASCRRWYRRRPLVSAFTHPSKMVYPPGEVYTPPESPEREVIPAKPEDYTIPHRDLSYEIGLIKSDSHYQQGPDTYLLQLRDTDFPVRVRKYMNLARERSPIAMFTGRDTSYDYERIPVVHERRRFTDIMDEEIEDERRRTMIDKYTSGFVRSKQNTCSLDLPRRVKREVTSRYTIRDEAEAIKMSEKEGGTAPFIREKPPTTAITPNMSVTLTCVVTGEPEPVIQWFRNDIILCDTSRMTITNEQGRSQLCINACRDFDVGFYKVVARNNIGQASHRFRLVRGEIPGMCDPPEVQEVSGTQVLLKWRTPIDDGAAPIELYHVQIKQMGEEEYTTVSDNIPQEIFLVEGLSPNKVYQFRVAAKNLRGWGEFSVSTPGIRTGGQDDASLKMPIEQQLQKKNPKLYVLQLPGARGEIRDLLDYGREVQNVPLKSGEAATLQMRKYKMVNDICRGRFSSITRCLRQDDQRTFACKIFLRREREEAVAKEYEMSKSLRHERLATVYEAYQLPEVTTFIMEYLGGPDVLTFLATKLQYTEQNVAIVLNQVLDGISYLHWRGFCHLDIQPDNVVVTSPNKLDVKLVDFGNTQKVGRSGTPAEPSSLVDYTAPEVLFEKKAFPNSDVWSLGVFAYALLTGSSPFVGQNEEETLANIQCVRFKFETLGELVSQEATRFIMLIFKRDPSKRPTEEECIDHKWLGENDFMVKKRERALLSTQRLREYCETYHKRRENQASNSNVFSSFMKDC